MCVDVQKFETGQRNSGHVIMANLQSNIMKGNILRYKEKDVNYI